MAKKKKPFPSQVRYQKKKPVVSFRLTSEKKLEEIAKLDGMSIGQYVRNFLHGIVIERKKRWGYTR